jgi:hypothetical protein
VSAEGIECAAEGARARSETLTGVSATARARSGGTAVAAALAHAAAAVLEAGELAQGQKLLGDALRELDAFPALRLVERSRG